jgi:hypothetical protein
MDGVEVAVELERGAGHLGVEPDRDGGGIGMSAVGAIDDKALGLEELRECIERRARFTRATGHRDQTFREMEQSSRMDRASELVREVVK